MKGSKYKSRSKVTAFMYDIISMTKINEKERIKRNLKFPLIFENASSPQNYKLQIKTLENAKLCFEFYFICKGLHKITLVFGLKILGHIISGRWNCKLLHWYCLFQWLQEWPLQSCKTLLPSKKFYPCHVQALIVRNSWCVP